MRIKTVPALIKTDGDGFENGEYESIVSVFGVTDRTGDVVEKGFFEEHLNSMSELPPTIWSHDHINPESYIGETRELKEVGADHPLIAPLVSKGATGGLYARSILDINTNDRAAKVYELLKSGRVNNHSFAYTVSDAAFEKRDEDWVMVLKRGEIFEHGPCLIGANGLTLTGAVKTADIGADIEIRSLIDALTPGQVKALYALLSAVHSQGVPDEPDAKSGTDDEPTVKVSSIETIRTRLDLIELENLT